MGLALMLLIALLTSLLSTSDPMRFKNQKWALPQVAMNARGKMSLCPKGSQFKLITLGTGAKMASPLRETQC